MSRFTERLQNTSRSRALGQAAQSLSLLCRETLGASPLWACGVIHYPGTRRGLFAGPRVSSRLSVAVLGLARETRGWLSDSSFQGH